jgi:hypothetical protein
MTKKSKGNISFGEAFSAIRYGIGPRRNEVYVAVPAWRFRLYFAIVGILWAIGLCALVLDILGII